MEQNMMQNANNGRNGRKKAWLLVVATAMSVMTPMNATAVLDGERDEGRHPYVVHLVMYQTTREGLTGAVVGYQKGFCTGFAISPTLVVTAGHCTVADQPGDVNGDGFVEHRQIEAVGIFTSEDPGAEPVYWAGEPHMAARMGFDAIGEAIPHPFYVDNYYDHEFEVDLYDVGVVVLRPETPLDLERYAQLPEVHAAQDLRMSASCASNGRAPCDAPSLLAVGYGRHDDEGNKSNSTSSRHVASLRYDGIEPRFEERYFRVQGGIGGHESIAAGGTCFGDSGGPLLLDGTDTALGVTATGPNPCDYTALGHRLDLPDILEWIQSYQ